MLKSGQVQSDLGTLADQKTELQQYPFLAPPRLIKI